MKIYRTDRWTLFNGDCVEVLKRMPADRFDAIATDSPYEFGFMGKAWDRSGVAFRPETWAAALRVLKPGGHLLAFGGSRTFHRIACAIEDGGFDIRDTLSWMYGTGFPKSLNVEAAVNQALNPDWESGDPSDPRAAWLAGRGTALKPAWEPIILARKPLSGTVAANVQAHGTGALNIDGCRIASSESTRRSNKAEMGFHGGNLADSYQTGSDVGRWPANVVLDEHAAAMLDEQTGTLKSGSMRAGVYAGRKSTVYPPDAGRPLANDIVGSSGGASRFFYVAKASRAERDAGCEALPARTAGEATDRSDDTAGLNNPRAGAGRTGGARNIHPTVKPVALMRWLVRLITPPGGCVLDPFAGSGSTGVAALQEGLTFVGIDQSAEYVEIARHRLGHVQIPDSESAA